MESIIELFSKVSDVIWSAIIASCITGIISNTSANDLATSKNTSFFKVNFCSD
jgi:hypothetical protein